MRISIRISISLLLAVWSLAAQRSNAGGFFGANSISAVSLATPTFSPVAGSYTGTQSVSITVPGGSTGCYTTDSSTPAATTPGTCSHGTTYSTAISVATSETVEAIATQVGQTNSSVGSAAYTITTGTWSLVHHTEKDNCGGAATTCTVTVPSTGAGNLLVVAGALYEGPTARPIAALTAGACSGSWQIPSGVTVQSTDGEGVNGAYCLSAAGSTTSIVVTISAVSNGSWGINILEYHWTGGGGITLDGTPASSTSGTVTNPSGVAQTLAGTTDVVVQWIRGTAPTAITGSYTNPADFEGGGSPGCGYAGWINTSSGAAPTWTQTAVKAGVASMAFRGN